MNTPFTRNLLAACAISCMATIALAGEFPVKLTIDTPTNQDGPALLSESGWPLTIKMVVDFPEGEEFPAYATSPNFAVGGNRGFIIFDDTDGCLYPVTNWLPQDTPECGMPEGPPEDWSYTKPPLNDILLEFWPDIDMAGVEDFSGNADRQLDLLDSAGSRGPEFQIWNADHECIPGTDDFVVAPGRDENDAGCIRFGPPTGGEITDGFGFGADDDITGLVVIAEYGVGRVFNEPAFELSDPIGAVNLAGLVNSVTYDLSVIHKDAGRPFGKGKPEFIYTEQARIWAHMNMDNGVLRHIIQYDGCTGEITRNDPDNFGLTSCDGDHLWRIDGGPVDIAPFVDPTGEPASVDLLESTTYTLKVFLVAGQAPNRLYDEDGDGDVDSVDAELAGSIVLSNEDSVSLLQLSREVCHGGGVTGLFAGDLDFNTEAFLQHVCPGGPGDLKRPPR